MSAFLKFTDTDGRPIYIRAAAVEAVNTHTEKAEAAFGVHPATAPDAESHTRVHVTKGYYSVSDSVEDVVQALKESGR